MFLPASSGAVYVPPRPTFDPQNWATQYTAVYRIKADPDLEGLYMSPIVPAQIGVGGMIGRRCQLHSSEIRVSVQSNVGTFIVSGGATIIGDSWVSGNGPQTAGVPSDIDFPPAYAPTSYEAGLLTPMRLIVAVDRQPDGSNPPEIQELLDYSAIGFGTMMVAPYIPERRHRFVVLHDEIIYPPPHNYFSFARMIDYDRLLGHPVLLQYQDSATVGTYAKVATNAPICWLGSAIFDASAHAPSAFEFSIRTVYSE